MTKNNRWNRTLPKRKWINKKPTQMLLSRKSNWSATGRPERLIKLSVSVAISWKFWRYFMISRMIPYNLYIFGKNFMISRMIPYNLDILGDFHDFTHDPLQLVGVFLLPCSARWGRTHERSFTSRSKAKAKCSPEKENYTRWNTHFFIRMTFTKCYI